MADGSCDTKSITIYTCIINTCEYKMQACFFGRHFMVSYLKYKSCYMSSIGHFVFSSHVISHWLSDMMRAGE